jgi:DNA-binding CsgD family transcriptional regulator
MSSPGGCLACGPQSVIDYRPGPRSTQFTGAEMPDGNGGPVTVLSPHYPLASALIAGLGALGWTACGDATGGLDAPVVVVADDQGRIRMPAACTVPPASRLLILVGGLACLDELADGLLLGASAAVNADLPFPEVLCHVDAILRTGPLPREARDRLRGRLGRRKAESARFGRLTDREAAVLADLAAGLAAADIARRRPVTMATVRTQIAEILRKLEVPSQTAAVALTYQACHDERILAALRFNQNY